MKKLGTILLLLSVVLFSGTSMAEGILSVNVIPGTNQRAVVSIVDAVGSKFNIEVTDSNGDLVYFKRVKSPEVSFEKMYDFSNLADGIYTFKVKTEKETEINTLEVKGGNAKIYNQQEDLKPYFALKGKFLELSYLNFAEKGMQLKVYDNLTSDLIFEKKLQPDFVVLKALDFSKLRKGKYTAVLESNDNAYEHVIELN